MKFSDEMLMAYADGELDAAGREAVEAAMAADPDVARAVARHQALRRDVFAAFAGILDEPVPARLQPQAGNVVPLAAARETARERARQEAAQRAPRRGWSWPEWGALAATLAIGVLAGGAGWHMARDDGAQVVLARTEGAVAGGDLADALSQGLAGAPRGDVRIGVSFVSRQGEYCRSFTLGSSAGMACRSGDAWRIPVLAEGQAEAATPYRQAGTGMPQVVLDAIDERIAGAALDAAGERAARARGWRR